jgi:hypothetical protein
MPIRNFRHPITILCNKTPEPTTQLTHRLVSYYGDILSSSDCITTPDLKCHRTENTVFERFKGDNLILSQNSVH